MHLFPHAMCHNFTYVFTLQLSIFMHNIYLGYKKNWCGEGCNFEIITFDYIYPFLKKHTSKMSAKCAQQSMIMILIYQIFCVLNPWSVQGLYDSLLPSISKHLEKFTILTDQIIHTLNMCLYASVCNNTVVMCAFIYWANCINNTGKIFVTEGKLREFHFG